MQNLQPDPRLAEFAAYAKTQSNLSEKTAKDYTAHVNTFAQFLAPMRAERAEESHVVQFISHCQDRGLKKTTIRIRLAAIKAFYQFLKRKNRLPHEDPTEHITLRDDENAEQREVLTRDDVQRLLSTTASRSVRRHKETPIRDKALLCLCYSGLKRNEVVALNFGDVNLDAKQCNIAGRTVPINEETVNALRAYLAVRPRNTRERAFFLSITEGRLTPREAWHIAKKAGLRAGIDKPVSPESLRVAFGVHWIEDDRDAFALAPILGIEPSGVENYAKLARKDSDATQAFALSGLSDALFDHLDMRRTKATWQKMLQRSYSDPEGAITQTRTLLEGISKHILLTVGTELPQNDNLSGMCKSALTAILPPDSDDDEHFTKFARIAAGLVEHLSLYRNTKSDAHASRDKRAVEHHQARFAVGLAASIAGFLVHCFEAYQSTNRNKRAASDHEIAVLSLARAERDVLKLLVQTAAKSSSGDTRTAYKELLRKIRPDNDRNHETYLHLTTDEVSLLYDTLPTENDGPKQLASVGKHLRSKLHALNRIK